MINKPEIRPAFIFLLLLFLLTLGFIAGALLKGTEKEVVHWDMPMAFPAANYQTKTAQGFADNVFACTNGELLIKIHANGSLFKGTEIKRAVQTGQAPIGERLLSVHANEDMLYTVDSIPFVASGLEASELLWVVAEDAMRERLEEDNLVLIYSVPWPPQGIYFNIAVNSTEDIAGMRFRSYSSATARIAELAGMIPVLIESAELTQALATGVVQTLMASGSTGYDSKIWEHLSYYYDIEAWRPRNYVIVNRDDYLALSKNTKACITDAAEKAQLSGTDESIRLGKWYLEQLRENGMQVIQPSAKFKSDLTRIGKAMTQEWLDATGIKGERIINQYYQRSAPVVAP